MISTLSLLLMLMNSINGQVHLDRSNLAQICNCDINSYRFNLSSKRIVSIDGKTFQGLSNLQTLLLDNNQLRSIDFITFQGLSKLSSIVLRSNQLSFMMLIYFKVYRNESDVSRV